jgi:hypothetical protein
MMDRINDGNTWIKVGCDIRHDRRRCFRLYRHQLFGRIGWDGPVTPERMDEFDTRIKSAGAVPAEAFLYGARYDFASDSYELAYFHASFPQIPDGVVTPLEEVDFNACKGPVVRG